MQLIQCRRNIVYYTVTEIKRLLKTFVSVFGSFRPLENWVSVSLIVPWETDLKMRFSAGGLLGSILGDLCSKVRDTE